jgi:hypothetical protein
MPVSILVPWGGNDPHRIAAWRHARAWYTEQFPDWQICIGTCEDVWCKAEAIARALGEAKGDTLVIADADCLVPGIEDAVQQVRDGWTWAVPHRLVHRLSQMGTAHVLNGGNPEDLPVTDEFYDRHPYVGFAGGGVTVIRRQAYQDVPLDHRFIGWGQEDQAWALALERTYGRPHRPSHGPLWHLWHPPQRRMSPSIGSAHSRELYGRYRRAAASGLLTELMAEPRIRCEELSARSSVSVSPGT